MGFFDMLGEAISNSMNNMSEYSAWLDEQPDEKLLREVKRTSGAKKLMIVKKLKERGYGSEVL